MSFASATLRYTSPADAPISFMCGERSVVGIPNDFSPTVTHMDTAPNVREHIIEGSLNGLKITGECTEYLDYPVTEWRFVLSNIGTADTDIISNIRVGGNIPCGKAVLTHGNGDTCRRDGYTFYDTAVDEKITLSPSAGTSCCGAFPYMTLHGEEFEVRAAIGFTAKWIAEITPTDDGVSYLCGQFRCRTRLSVGESYTTPRLTLMAYRTDDKYYGINLWRHFYFAHIIPKPNGKPIPPLACMHYFEADGMPEFTGASEKNQLEALNTYISRGIKPDVLWIDAGWYPCDGEWYMTGTWMPDGKRFPNGLAPIGRACRESGVKLLLWFEPERVRGNNNELKLEHSEWLLSSSYSPDNSLFNLGNPAALEWITNRVDSIIKESGVEIYRQDFNFDQHPACVENEAPEHEGYIENAHMVGYYKYWDELVRRNPGLIIDSCSSGGRRNDLETMRRAVTLHYTDIGYGDHPIKQKQYREMFEWIPYFRSHTNNWYNRELGEYDGKAHATDRFTFLCSLAPSITDTLRYDASDEEYALSKKMQPIWRHAAELELRGDYYPITDCDGTPDHWYAMQFDDGNAKEGFVLVIRNANAADDVFALNLPCIEGVKYTFTNPENGEATEYNSEELKQGLKIALDRADAVVLFYTYL